MTLAHTTASDAVREAVGAGLADYYATSDRRRTKAAIKRLLVSTADALGTTLDRVLLLTPVRRSRHGREVSVYLLHFDFRDETVDILRALKEKETRDVYWDGMNYQCWCAVRQDPADLAPELVEALRAQFSFVIYTDPVTVITGDAVDAAAAGGDDALLAEPVDVAVTDIHRALEAKGRGVLVGLDLWVMTEGEFIKCESPTVRTRHACVVCRVSSQPRPQYFTYDAIGRDIIEMPSVFHDRDNLRLMSEAKRAWAKRHAFAGAASLAAGKNNPA